MGGMSVHNMSLTPGDAEASAPAADAAPVLNEAVVGTLVLLQDTVNDEDGAAGQARLSSAAGGPPGHPGGTGS